MVNVQAANGNGSFFQKFQGVATIGGVLFVMIATVTGLAYTALSERIGKIEINRFTSAEFSLYRELVHSDSKRIDDRFLEFRARTEKIFEERRDDIGNLRREIGGSANLRDVLSDLKKEQGEQQRQILDIIKIMGTKQKEQH